MIPNTTKTAFVDTSLHGYAKRLRRARYVIKQLPNDETTLRFLDHLGALGLSVARVAKYSSHLPVILRMINMDLKDITKSDVEAIVAEINGCPHKEWTKHESSRRLFIR